MVGTVMAVHTHTLRAANAARCCAALVERYLYFC